MKNLVFGLIASVMFGFVGNGQVTGGSVGVTFDFGRNSRGCNGIGICKVKKVDIKLAFSGKGTKLVSTLTSFDAEISSLSDGTIKVEVDESNMESIRNLYGGSKLVLEEDFVFYDTDVLKAINKTTHKILKGQYTFSYDKISSKYVLYL